jgi:hypothetical protein
MRGDVHPGSRVVRLLAFAALIFHVCALDAVAQEFHAREVSSAPLDSERGHGPDLHGGSCDGIKPGLSGFVPVAVSNRLVPGIPVTELTGPPTVGSAPVPVSGPPLFLLHTSLLI